MGMDFHMSALVVGVYDTMQTDCKRSKCPHEPPLERHHKDIPLWPVHASKVVFSAKSEMAPFDSQFHTFP